ncbi:MAG: MFS transporter [Elusimicrobiota bacterium]
MSIYLRKINKRKNFLLLVLSGILIKSAWDILVPLLPTYLFKHTGSASTTGLIMGSGPLITIFFRPYLGKLIKKSGAKKFILLGLLSTLTGTILFSFSTLFYLLLLARMLQGSGLILFFFSSLILVNRMVPSSRRGELFGLYMIVFVFPLIFSPLIGSLMQRQFTFQAAVFSSVILIIFSFLFALFIKDLKSPQSPLKVHKGGFKAFFKPALAAPLALVFFIIFTDAGIMSFLPLVAKQFNIQNFALYFSLFALSSITTRILLGKKFDLIPRRYAIGAGTLLVITGILLLANFTLSFLIAAGVIYGIGFGFTDSNLLPCLMARVKDQSQESAIIAYSIAFDLAYLIAPPLLGFLGDRTGFRILYISCALIVLISSSFFMLSGERNAYDLF